MAEIPHHLTCKEGVNDGIKYQPQMVSRISDPSTVLSKLSTIKTKGWKTHDFQGDCGGSDAHPMYARQPENCKRCTESQKCWFGMVWNHGFRRIPEISNGRTMDWTDPEKTWVSNSSIATYLVRSVGKVPFHFLIDRRQPLSCAELMQCQFVCFERKVAWVARATKNRIHQGTGRKNNVNISRLWSHEG